MRKKPKRSGDIQHQYGEELLEKNCFYVGLFCAFFRQSIEMPFKCGSQVLPRPGEQLSSHTHTCKPGLGAHSRSDRHQTWSETLQQQLLFPPGSTENWAKEDTWDMAWEQVTVGQTNSVASKGVSTGIKQKCFKHSLHPEKECVWKTAEDRNQSVLW